DALLGLGAHGPGAREALAGLGLEQLRLAASWAAHAAAVTVSRPGADPPTRAALDGAPEPGRAPGPVSARDGAGALEPEAERRRAGLRDALPLGVHCEDETPCICECRFIGS